MPKLPELITYEEKAIDAVAYAINKAKCKMGVRLTLMELAINREKLARKSLVTTRGRITPPIAINGEKFIRETIEKDWKLTKVFKYCIKYKNCSSDETSKYYYYEVIFSQPSIQYPVAQTTASVYFRITERLLEKRESEETTPKVTFRVEGHHIDHDVCYIRLHPDFLLGVLQMKLKLFKKVENLSYF